MIGPGQSRDAGTLFPVVVIDDHGGIGIQFGPPLGRTGSAFTRFGELNMRNARHAEDPAPIDPACACPACRDYSRGYIHHLVKSKEILGSMLLTWHNLHYYQELMAGLREAIAAGALADFTAVFAAQRAKETP